MDDVEEKERSVELIREMDRMAELVELTIIGGSISEILNAAFGKMDELGLTMEDVDKFERYLEKMDAFSPLIFTTWNIQGGAAQIRQAQARVEIVKDLIKFKAQPKSKLPWP